MALRTFLRRSLSHINTRSFRTMILPKYMRTKIGTGSIGIVYKANYDGRIIAIKEYKKRITKKPSEFSVIMKLKDGPHIIKYIGYNRFGGRKGYGEIYMEYYPYTFQNKRFTYLNFAQAHSILLGMCKGLQYCKKKECVSYRPTFTPMKI